MLIFNPKNYLGCILMICNAFVDYTYWERQIFDNLDYYIGNLNLSDLHFHWNTISISIHIPNHFLFCQYNLVKYDVVHFILVHYTLVLYNVLQYTLVQYNVF